MLDWDDKFINKLKELGINTDIYKRYVDDIFTGLNFINKGWSFRDNRMVFSEHDKMNDDKPDEIRTAEILVNIANTIDPNIQLTWDVPSRNINNRMPVLDLELWVKDNVIYHSFYKKKVSSQYTILKRSALSYSIKKNTMLQEALRRLGNISSGLPKEETTKVMTKYSNMLRISG